MSPQPSAPVGPKHVVATFGRLKLTLLRNGARMGAGQAAVMFIAWGVALVAGSLGLVAVASLRGAPSDFRAAVIVVVFALSSAVALIAPVLFLGIDEAVSPERLALYPLSPGRRLLGLAVAASIGAPGLGLFLVLVGAVIAVTSSVVGLPLVLLAATAELWSCLVASRLLVTLMARFISSRRGRDVAVVLGSLLGFSGVLFQFLSRYLSPDPATIRALERLARWSPPGALGRALVEAGSGNVVAAVAPLALGLVGLALLVVLWAWALDRLEATPPSAGEARRRHSSVAHSPLFGKALAWLPRTPAGAVSARELRYQLRDPRRRVQAVTALLFGVGFPLLNALNGTSAGRSPGGGEGPGSAAVLFAAGAGWLVVLGAMNQLGMDGRALWFDLLSGAPPRVLLKGKNMAFGTLAVTLSALASLVLAAVTGGWAFVPAALLTGVATTAAGLGVANLTSVFSPTAISESSNPFAINNAGQGCAVGTLILVAMVGLVVVLSPVVVALVLLRSSPLACLVVGALSVPYGIGLRAAGTAVACSHLRGREPEFLALVNPRR